MTKDWLEKVCAGLPEGEAALVRRARATLLGNVLEAEPWAPWRGIVPSVTSYGGIWNWDAGFHAVGVSLWDPELAREQFDILFARQQENGMLPDCITSDGKVKAACTKPPIMTWAIAVVDRRDGNTDYLADIYPKVTRLGEFWEKERGGNRDGLFYYAGCDAGWDSGWDDSIRFDDGYRHAKSDDCRLFAIDLNCYMVSHYRAMAYIAGRLGKGDDRTKWTSAGADLAARINARLWDERCGSYVDVDRKTGKPAPVLSPACFMPLFVHIAPPDRAGRMSRLAADPAKFHPGMPSAAYDTPKYDSRQMWRGPAWLNTSYFALKGLKDYGHTGLAAEMRAIHLGWLSRNESLREYYDSRNGDGLGAEAFGWSAAFTLAFICDWDNDALTWLFQPVPVPQ